MVFAGPEYVSGQKTLTWPAGNRGVCGDKAGSHDHEPGQIDTMPMTNNLNLSF